MTIAVDKQRAAARARRYRRRRREGEPSLVDALILTGRLDGFSESNKAEIGRATGRLLLDFIAAAEALGADPLKPKGD